MVKFKQFLRIAKDFDGELFTTKHESRFGSFGWDKDDIEFTPKGKEWFKNILDSDIIVLRKNNIELQNENITQDDLDFFIATVGGFVTQRDYDMLVKPKEKRKLDKMV